MKVIIIGGGRVPYFLAKRLIGSGYDVYFVNKSKELCDEYSRTLNATIINGDGTSKYVLDQLQIEPNDIIVLLTERDRKNFFIARLVQEYYKVKNVVTLLNNTENEDIFQRYGIRTLKVTDLIMNNIEPLLFGNKVMKDLEEELTNKGAEVLMIPIEYDSKIAHKELKELNVPQDMLVVGVIRKNRFIISRGDTVIEPGDELIIVCASERRSEAEAFFRM